MNQILDLLTKLFRAMIGGSLGLMYEDGDPRVFYNLVTFTAASEKNSCAIQFPSNSDRGWAVQGLFCEPTAVDFYVDIERSGKRGGKLTDGSTYSSFVLPKRSTLEKSAIPPFVAEDKETLTFNLTNGATASNVVKIGVIAVRR